MRLLAIPFTLLLASVVFSIAQTLSNAVSELTTKAETGDLDALFKLGKAYFNGDGIPFGLDEARSEGGH